ncbi:MAG: ABC transporter permease [Spirochaetota bacterium]|nr:ABC transporter permease [Spirochaetota bacterium]
MSGILVLTKRELKSYFASPIAYIVAFIFLFLTGNMFYAFLDGPRQAQAQVGPLLGNFLLFIIFLCPVLTIKSFSEEKRSGTLELLLTSPISALELVLAKFFAAFALYASILMLTLVYVFFMDLYSAVGPDYGVVFTAYLGLLLLGGSMIAIGVFTSSLTQSQVIAAISGFGISLFFLLIQYFTSSVDSGFIKKVLKELSLLSHYYTDFDRGVLSTEHIIYYLVWIVFSLLLASNTVESHKWK